MLTINIIELVLLFVSAALIIPQLFLLKDQIQKEHEARRRESTIKIMESWCVSVRKDTSIAEQVARKLNQEQCKSLYEHRPFTVSEEIKKEICKFCPLNREECANCTLNTNEKSHKLDGKILAELRWHVITYLNTLETVMVAWHLGVVDRKIIEEQFHFLTDPDKGTTLAEFRHSAGGYPMIEAFIDTIKDTKPKTKPKNIL